MNKLHQLHQLGQSIWLDYIRRSFTRAGDLARLVEQGVRGVTSNPTIFEKAITGSDDYDDDLREVMQDGGDAESIYERLAITDIREAADALRPVYDASRRADGYVSLEVSPSLARDTDGTIEAAGRLFRAVDRPNLMIKIPATSEGVPAVRAAICAGINVNVTLIFSLDNYEEVAEAYISGLEEMASLGGDPSRVASVASFFVSRIDAAVEKKLAALGAQMAAPADAPGSIAVDNARLAYARYGEIFSGPRWERLLHSGAREQRLLWASTGTKSDRLPDTFYVDELIGGPTVNTVPPATLDAFLDHGTVAATLAKDPEGARQRIEQLADVGVNLEDVTAELQTAGVESFAASFSSLLSGVEEKRSRRGRRHREHRLPH